MSRCTMPALMHVAQCRGELAGDVGELRSGDRAAGDGTGQRAALDQFHDQVGERVGRVAGVAPGVEHHHQAGMAQARQEVHLGGPADVAVGHRGVLVEHLDRHVAVERRVAGPEHLRHSAPAQRLAQDVPAVQHCGFDRRWALRGWGAHRERDTRRGDAGKPRVSCAAMPRLWFNRAYATTWHVIGMIRNNPDGVAVDVLGSHTDPHSPVLAACDRALVEPELGEDDYVDWAVQVAARRSDRHPGAARSPARAGRGARALRGRRHPADVPVPRRPSSCSRTRPPATGRGRRTRAAGAAAPCRARLGRAARRVCRLRGDRRAGLHEAGGRRGRRGIPAADHGTDQLDRRARRRGALARPARRRLPRAGRGRPARPARHAVPGRSRGERRRAGRPRRAGARGDRAPARHRAARRLRTIVDDAAAREIAEALTATHRVGYLSNTQVKAWQGRPYLLELNTRAAGGIFQTALAGVNLPWAAIRLALDEDPGELRPAWGATYTEVASFVQLGPSR